MASVYDGVGRINVLNCRAGRAAAGAIFLQAGLYRINYLVPGCALFCGRALKPVLGLCETGRFDSVASESGNVALGSAVLAGARPGYARQYLPWVLALCAAPLLVDNSMADDSMVVWPAGWQVQTLPGAGANDAAKTGDTQTLGARASRQRAVKADGNGDPAMVVELTRTPLAPDHQVNLAAVLLQMRKAMQIDFSKGGYQSVCNTIHPGTLGNLAAMETTCKVLLNGGHVMTQTLVAATAPGSAWSLSYAGSAQGYSDNETAVKGIRDSLIFNSQP